MTLQEQRLSRALAVALCLAILIPSLSRLAHAQTDAASFIIGPQLPISNSWFDQTQLNRGRVHADAFPAEAPQKPPSPVEPRRVDFATNEAYQTALTAWASDPIIKAWFDALDKYILAHYYDLGYALYALYARTKDPADLARARKVCDSWWKHPTWIGQGTIRKWPDEATPSPRHAGLGGLMLRALDGRPEMWDWIAGYTRFHFDLWLKRRVNDPQLYYGLREGGYMLHYATWLAKALPDSYPLQAGGTATNGAQIRAQLLADVEAVAVNYFGRLQKTDGSWRWNTATDEFVDTDGGTLLQTMQPFMVGLLLNALIDVHRLTTNPTVQANVANQILKGARHLIESGAYRKNEAVPADPNKRWRSFWYFYHGGTSVNPTRYQTGGGSENGSQLWHVKSERQSIGLVLPAFSYAYEISRDEFYRTAFLELWSAGYGGEDGIRNEFDGTAKNYNQNARGAASALARMAHATASPSPTAIPTPVPSPSPSPTVTPTPQPSPTPKPIPESRVVTWPSSKSARQTLWDQMVRDNWKCVAYDGVLYCWR